MKHLLHKLVGGIVVAATLVLAGTSGVYAASLTSLVGDKELIYATWSEDNSVDKATVYYKKTSDATYTRVDSPLVRSKGDGGRVDIPGLSAGTYDVRIEAGDGTVFNRTGIQVEAYDRSGYAHFNYTEGVGAYNDDGTLKDGAQIIYLTNENKNTITLGKYTGIGDIMSHASKITTPLVVRVIGTVDTQAWDADGTKTTDINNGVVAIDNLSDRIAGDGEDTYFNMLEVRSASNLTIEGIGDDAVIEKWGMAISDATGAEVRNLTFTKYPEDGCSTNRGSRIWIHNNTFNIGENKYDLTPEQDKGEGDGSTDIIQSQYVTLSYNRYNNTHKTSLHGGGDSVKQYNITWHHNYFNQVSSRMPLVRHANVHMYNNYFYKGTNCVDARASAWVFTENNYFDNCKFAYKTSVNTTEGNPVVKAWNDTLVSSGKEDKAGTIFTASSREQSYSVAEYKEDYANFDTNADLFYYDTATKTSKVTNLTSASQAKTDCVNESGAQVSKSLIQGTEVQDTTNSESTSESTTESTSESTTESTTESTSESTTEPTTSEPVPPGVYIQGDADASGLLTSNDAANILKKALYPDFVTPLDRLVDNAIKLMDMNGDGTLDAADAALVLSQVLNPTI